MFNMIFAKNELLFDNNRTAVFLDIMWRLLEFKTEAEEEEDDVS